MREHIWKRWYNVRGSWSKHGFRFVYTHEPTKMCTMFQFDAREKLENTVDLFDTVQHLYLPLLSTSEDLMTQHPAESVSAFRKQGKWLSIFCFFLSKKLFAGQTNHWLAPWWTQSNHMPTNPKSQSIVFVFAWIEIIHQLLFAYISVCITFQFSRAIL